MFYEDIERVRQRPDYLFMSNYEKTLAFCKLHFLNGGNPEAIAALKRLPEVKIIHVRPGGNDYDQSYWA